jgi:hypothetical protein
MQDMDIEVKVPFRIVIEIVKLASGGVISFVAPCEQAILQMNLIKVTSLKRCSKTVNATSVDVALLFLVGSLDLIEVKSPRASHRTPSRGFCQGARQISGPFDWTLSVHRLL